MAEQYATCPRCGNDDLILLEVHEEWGETEGRHRVVNGQIIPASDFYFEPGDTIRVLLRCRTGCGHEWTSRRSIGTEAPDA